MRRKRDTGFKADVQVIASTQMATKLMTNDNKPATFETGDRAVLMPQLGG